MIALCYNHARFVVECLESIRAQTCQDFQLIVTDDASGDGSPTLITDWLQRHYPDATFISHAANAGLCRTLNEALRLSVGDYISMIAADDVWEPDKVEKQLQCMNALGTEVAVVYSDALQIDECGQVQAQSFIQAHGNVGPPPLGRIFSRLADGNFIPAMSTLIRRSALEHVGGYDERLTYEDFDMWLRLSREFAFQFLPGELARYRVVPTSMVRTLFVEPTPAHSHTLFLIAGKWLDSDALRPDQRPRWIEREWMAAYNLFRHNDARAAACLWTAFQRSFRPRAGILAVAQSVGLTRPRLICLTRRLGRRVIDG